MGSDTASGIDLSRAYWTEVVEPLVAERCAHLRVAAGRLGSGSDVLGFDDLVSRDHDWGLRLSLFVAQNDVDAVQAELTSGLPPSFRAHPTRFAFSGSTEPVHHVEVTSVSDFLIGHLGFDPRAGISVPAWLSLSGQAVLEVTAGPVFLDQTGDLTSARRLLAWYPDDIWRYVLACDWQRVSQELPLAGRAADVGDEIGSRIIAARLVKVVIHLTFLLERRWPPYAKWLGSAFARLSIASEIGAAVEYALVARDMADRQGAIADALQALLRRQNALGLTTVQDALIPFWDRPYVHPDPAIAAELLSGITSPEVRGLPPGLGSIEQRTDNVDLLVSPAARMSATMSTRPESGA